ncbi:MAG: transcriptional regulator [Nitrososphaeria archaeon]
MKGTGVILVIMGIVCAIIYTILMFFSPWKRIVVEISAYLSMMIVIAFLIFIGYLIATTPENKPVSVEERVQKLLEEEK